MYQQNQLQQPVHPASLGKRALQGAGIALVVIVLFLQGAHTNPAWHKLWLLRPLLVVPAAGALGGMFYYFMDHLRYQKGWKRLAANLLSFVVYLVGLWLGIILGLAGTLWD